MLKEESSRVTIVGNSNIKFRSTNSSDTGSYTCMMEVGDEVFERVYNLEVLGNNLVITWLKLLEWVLFDVKLLSIFIIAIIFNGDQSLIERVFTK